MLTEWLRSLGILFNSNRRRKKKFQAYFR